MSTLKIVTRILISDFLKEQQIDNEIAFHPLLNSENWNSIVAFKMIVRENSNSNLMMFFLNIINLMGGFDTNQIRIFRSEVKKIMAEEQRSQISSQLEFLTVFFDIYYDTNIFNLYKYVDSIPILKEKIETISLPENIKKSNSLSNAYDFLKRTKDLITSPYFLNIVDRKKISPEQFSTVYDDLVALLDQNVFDLTTQLIESGHDMSWYDLTTELLKTTNETDFQNKIFNYKFILIRTYFDINE